MHFDFQWIACKRDQHSKHTNVKKYIFLPGHKVCGRRGCNPPGLGRIGVVVDTVLVVRVRVVGVSRTSRSGVVVVLLVQLNLPKIKRISIS